MPDSQPVNTKPLMAMIMMVSAATLALVAGLIYAGIVPVPEESRGLVTSVVGVAAAADFLVGLWFFRMGQSS